MRKVRILQEASEEAIAAADWYDKEREGLGKEFASAVEIAFGHLGVIIPWLQ